MAEGTLFLVVGPSGAGKDTLIDGARAALKDDPGFVFARRVITRPASAGGEDHTPATTDSFARDRAAGAFLLSWSAHGLDYGVPASYAGDLAAGRNVIANVSRSVIRAAVDRVARVGVIHVTAPDDLLARRLAGRGREDAAAIAKRLDRKTSPLPDNVATTEIVTDDTVEAGVRRFLAALQQPDAAPC